MPEQTRGHALLFDPLSVDSIVSVLEQLWLDEELCLDLRQRGFNHAREWNQTEFARSLKSIVQVALKDSSTENL